MTITWVASAPEWITAIASVFALVGVFAIVWQIRLQKQQLTRDIENDYVRRYWCIRDAIDGVAAGSPEERRWRLAYLRLCEDQIDLHGTPGAITEQTWKHWDAGMRAEIRRLPVYRSVLDEVHPDELVGVRVLYAASAPPDTI